MYQRAELQMLRSRLTESRKFIQVVLGPRQVGKSTMLSQFVDQTNVPCLFESADDLGHDGSVWLEQIWNGVRLKLTNQSLSEYILIIDEVQKIGNWSETVKKLWDEDTKNQVNIKLVLLGSSQLLVQQGLSESLTGRFELIHLSHWSFHEMRDAFGWNANQYVWFGGYPGSAELVDHEERWKRYIRDSLIETSISKDILLMTRIDKPSLLKRLFEFGCNYSGQILSFNKIMGQLHDAGNTTTLSHYLKLLDTAGLLGGLQKYSTGFVKQRSSSPKFQVFNTALLSAQHNSNFQELMADPEQWGRLVESAIGSYLINQSVTKNFKLYYWREGNLEVDFVLERGDQLIGIEVKTGASKYTKGMQGFAKKFHPKRVYLIDNKQLSWEEFLGIDPLELF